MYAAAYVTRHGTVLLNIRLPFIEPDILLPLRDDVFAQHCKCACILSNSYAALARKKRLSFSPVAKV